MSTLTYENDCPIEVEDLTQTILEISLENDIPHVHACGGHAKCSTCRVLILEHPENLEPRNKMELELARKKGLGDNIRLGCQTRIKGPVSIRRLVLDDEDTAEALKNQVTSTGRDMKLAVLFSDIRNFTSFSEKHLPYDIIHSLNRYFHAMGDCVKSHDGLIDKYMGDGLMALFGLNSGDPHSTCLQAARAALDMQESLKSVNTYLQNHLGEEFRIGIGLHFGEVIVGDMGHPESQQFTALGDNVNFTSRIESATKKADAGILVSQDFYENVKDDIIRGRVFQAKLKGKSGSHRLIEITGSKDGLSNITKSKAGSRGADPERVVLKKSPNHETDFRDCTGFILEEQEIIAEQTLAFRLAVTERDFEFKAGQFIQILIPGIDDNSRYFSIASAPSRKDEILLATRIRASEFKETLMNMPRGIKILMRGPDGDMTIKPGETRPIILIAGGIGVTPMRSMVEEAALNDGFSSPVYLFHSNRTVDQAVFYKEFWEWDEKLPNFHYIPVLTREKPKYWKGEKGHLNRDMLIQHVPDLKQCLFYLAGPENMIAGISRMLKNADIKSDSIISEAFVGY